MSDPLVLLQRAMARRRDMIPADTDTYRLFDGAGDGWPGVLVETFAGHWLVETDGPPPAGMENWCRSLPCRSLWWKKLDSREKDGPVLVGGDPPPELFPVRENGLVFEASFQSGYSHGIFSDQRLNRRFLLDHLQPGKTLLNLFAYTCAFSVAAACRGGVATSIDLSQRYLDWGKRNMLANGQEVAAHGWIKGDVREWLSRFRKQGRSFDWVILDPPTFGRGPKGAFRVEDDLPGLLQDALAVTAPGGKLMVSTNCRRLPSARFSFMIQEALAILGRRGKVERQAMPPEYTGEPGLKCAWIAVD